MSYVLLLQAYYAIALAVCLLALWKGGPPERFGAGLILAIVILQRVISFILAPSIGHFPPVDPVIRLIGDGVTAVGLLGISLRYASLWLGGAMLLYAAQFTLHSYYFVTHRPNDNFHAAVNNIDFVGIILCLAIGTAVSWRRRVVADKAAARASAAAAAAAEAP
jgi:hypothetical protein